MPKSYPLEPSRSEMEKMSDAAVRFVIDFIEDLPESPAGIEEGAGELARRLAGEAPSQGRPFSELLEVIAQGASKSFNTAGPGYLAFIPGGGLFASAVADFVASTINRYVGIWDPAPALAQIEWNVVRWFCDLFGFPASARGILTSGGSLANFSAIITARKALLPENFLNGTIYLSDQAHHSLPKAAAVAGFPESSVRQVPVDGRLRMNPDALRRMIAEDRESGRRPFLIVGSAGTTNTGAVDPLPELREIAGEQDMWLHVDGAYGAFFRMTERGVKKLEGIDAADSITLDPHKTLFVPYGCGGLIVRDGEKLRAAHHHEAHYIQDLDSGEGIDFADHSPELSRDFRGLRVWLPIELHGMEAFREALDEKLDLTQLLYESIYDLPDFEVPWEPELSVVAFRYLPESGDANDFNQTLLRRINESQRIFLSSTTIGGVTWLRACIVSHRTHRDRIEEAAEIIRRSAAELAGA